MLQLLRKEETMPDLGPPNDLSIYEGLDDGVGEGVKVHKDSVRALPSSRYSPIGHCRTHA
jgi:hypothetical protein